MPTIPRKMGTAVSPDRTVRKFLSTDVEARGVSRQNEEFSVDVNSSLDMMSSVVSKVAEIARNNIDTVRARLSEAGSQKDTVHQKSTIDVDVQVALDGFSSEIARVTDVSPEFSKDLVNLSPNAVLTKKDNIDDVVVFNPVIPSLDSVHVDIDQSKGSIDCFFSTIRFSLPEKAVNDKNIVAVRIFRATTLSPTYVRGFIPIVSMRGLEILSSNGRRTKEKVQNRLESLANSFRDSGVKNSIDELNPKDQVTGLRVSSEQFSSGSQPESLDKSVASDPKTLENIRKAQGSSVQTVVDQEFSVSLTKSSDTKTSNEKIISTNNFAEFREFALISLDKIRSTKVGDTLEYSIIDETIGYGKGYKYFIVSVNKDMVESVRSQIIDVVVEAIRVPPRPKNVFTTVLQTQITLTSIVEDKLVEKFEIYKRTQAAKFSRDINSSGYNVSISIQRPLSTGFTKIGESLNSSAGGGAFIDRDVIPGRRYDYRVYSVDVFGNKSESPFEVSAFCPEKSVKNNDLTKPTMTSEVDSTTGKIRLTFKCSDTRVTRLFLSRKDLTIGQHAFSTPSQVNRIKLGNAKAGQGNFVFDDVVLRGETKDVSWTGMFENTVDETVFIDRSVSLDHVYQYKLYGVDKFGNVTASEITKPTMVTRRPMLDAPVNLVANIVQGQGFTVGGISLSWQESNVDVTSEDMLGSQNSLRDTATRTLYQVERKRLGDEIWYEFPLIESKTFYDASESTLGETTPGFRPPFVAPGETYVYRVKCMQTGSFVSNYSNQVEIFASLPIVEPQNFRLRASDVRVKPFFVSVNWDTSNASGPVDRWELQRSHLNNFAAAKINLKNPDEFSRLSFKKFRDIYNESSRFSSQANDSVNSSSKLFTGQHFFQDVNVKVGNTYYYRIRAIGADGNVSAWVYRGIKITDSVFERRSSTAFSDDDVRELSETGTPISLDVIGETKKSTIRSFSLQPDFSNPYVTPEASVSAVEEKKTSPKQVATYDTAQGGSKTR